MDNFCFAQRRNNTNIYLSPSRKDAKNFNNIFIRVIRGPRFFKSLPEIFMIRTS